MLVSFAVLISLFLFLMYLSRASALCTVKPMTTLFSLTSCGDTRPSGTSVNSGREWLQTSLRPPLAVRCSEHMLPKDGSVLCKAETALAPMTLTTVCCSLGACSKYRQHILQSNRSADKMLLVKKNPQKKTSCLQKAYNKSDSPPLRGDEDRESGGIRVGRGSSTRAIVMAFCAVLE